MATPLTRIVLRSFPIPRSAVIDQIERQTGRSLTHEHRHYLAEKPVHCGDELEIYRKGRWIRGRYEWTGRPEDPPTLETGSRVLELDATHLLRWPK
jgi:hypothetical protein